MLYRNETTRTTRLLLGLKLITSEFDQVATEKSGIELILEEIRKYIETDIIGVTANEVEVDRVVNS